MGIKSDTEYIFKTGSIIDSDGNIAIEHKQELVRCKDCKYGSPCIGGELIKHCEQHPDEEYFDSDYFCADGERRES